VNGSHNLIKTCGLSNNASGNITGVDPNLGPLKNNGGATLTMAPQAGSPAINAADTASQACPATDQRGVMRPQGGACDIGAVESLTWPRAYLPRLQK
jgi:hypothetical protein